MTALKKYNRLECDGLWRASASDRDTATTHQRRQVIVALGNATLVLSDKNAVALAHWSLPAIHRVNPKQRPAIFSPSEDSSETLELEEGDMIDALEQISKAIERSRPKPGRLRYAISAGIIGLIAFGAVFWLPDALIQHTVSVVPTLKRVEIGKSVLGHLTQTIGKPCNGAQGLHALSKLARRLPNQPNPALFVFPNLTHDIKHLPGGVIILNQALIERYDDPGIVAGYILAEYTRAKNSDPIENLLRNAGLTATFELLTTGNIPTGALQKYASYFMNEKPADISTPDLLGMFETAHISATPYAYTVDPTGETTIDLIEADPFTASTADPVLSDGDWIRLQGICDG